MKKDNQIEEKKALEDEIKIEEVVDSDVEDNEEEEEKRRWYLWFLFIIVLLILIIIVVGVTFSFFDNAIRGEKVPVGDCVLNCDLDGDGICDLNCDTDDDGVCDYNCDLDNDGECDYNCDYDNDKKCDLNCDYDKDKECDYNCDTDDDGHCDYNCIGKGEEDCQYNCDADKDEDCDYNCDTDDDGDCDYNCNPDNDKDCDYNCDIDEDGDCDYNCDTNDDDDDDNDDDDDGDDDGDDDDDDDDDDDNDDDIIFNYTDINGIGNGIHLKNARDISDEVGKKLLGEDNTFDFNVSGKSKSGIKYMIVLDAEESTTISLDDIKVYLTKFNGTTETEVLSTIPVYGSLENVNIDGKTYKKLYTYTVSKSVSAFYHNYRLRLWIREGADDYYSKTLKVKVHVLAEGLGD